MRSPKREFERRCKVGSACSPSCTARAVVDAVTRGAWARRLAVDFGERLARGGRSALSACVATALLLEVLSSPFTWCLICDTV
ncbi:uncharacterized protein SOCE836_100350 [Sorangium cellulosum]|uniref:Uncharacterized protein n=1 Tax=Sorangium cellulosum TaxID=56 RepID=A0A4P2R424_SORCE|nr:uncharacterized protein SOCE836_100350 [Sorangium cellulosum]WCQ97091.1 hypothetical protein NQZ70_09882 [Sorangium sp. Soce836]